MVLRLEGTRRPCVGAGLCDCCGACVRSLDVDCGVAALLIDSMAECLGAAMVCREGYK